VRGHNDVRVQLLDVDFGPPLHSFVIPGEMHHIEEEVVQTFRLPNQPDSGCPAVEGKQLPPPPSTIAGAAVAPTLDPATVSAAVSSWGVSFLVFWFAHQQENPTTWSRIAISVPLTYKAYDDAAIISHTNRCIVLSVLRQWPKEPAALQALIADATARLVELAEAGNSNQTVANSVTDAGTGPGAESAHSASESTQVLPPAAVTCAASSSNARSKAGSATTTQHRHAIDDLEEGTFEGSVDAMDGFLDDLGDDSD